MKVSEIASILGLNVFSGVEGMDAEVTGGYVSDLLSDVMGNATEGNLWITLQTHINIMAVASLKDLAGIILVNGNKPNEDTIAKSNDEGIPILGTEESCFDISGKLYTILKVE